MSDDRLIADNSLNGSYQPFQRINGCIRWNVVLIVTYTAYPQGLGVLIRHIITNGIDFVTFKYLP